MKNTKDIIILPMFDGCIVNQQIPIEDLNELSKEFGLKWCSKTDYLNYSFYADNKRTIN